MLGNAHWEPKQPTVFYVIALNISLPVVVHTAPAFFGFNHVNGYEDADGRIVMDILTNGS